MVNRSRLPLLQWGKLKSLYCAPVHVLVIPREPIAQLAEATPEHQALLGHLLLVAAKVAQQEGLSSWRTVINSGAEAGQTVFHLHVHVIGGRPLAWPPG